MTAEHYAGESCRARWRKNENRGPILEGRTIVHTRRQRRNQLPHLRQLDARYL